MSSCPSPVSLLKVRGSYQVLGCELDQSNLMLAESIGEDGSRSQVFAARYHEPETGISHAVAVKRFPPPRTQQELKSVQHLPSKIAAAAVSLALQINQLPSWVSACLP